MVPRPVVVAMLCGTKVRPVVVAMLCGTKVRPVVVAMLCGTKTCSSSYALWDQG